MSYFSTDLITGLHPKSDFPVLQSHYVEVEDDGRRLDQRLPFLCTTLPTASADNFMTTAILAQNDTTVPYICLRIDGAYQWVLYSDLINGGTGVDSLESLSDVQISQKKDQDILYYNNADSKWENRLFSKRVSATEYALIDGKYTDNVIYFVTND